MHHMKIAAVLLMTFPCLCYTAPPDGKGKGKTEDANTSFDDTLSSFDTERWQAADGWANGSPFLNAWSANALTFSGDGLAITLSDIPSLGYDYTSGELRTSQFYGYGCYEAEIKPSAVSGVVTAFFTFAGPFDRSAGGNGQHNEIDIEFLGNNTNIVQFNFWTNDDQYINGHESIYELGFDASESFNHYAFKWTEEGIRWYINNNLVYTVLNSANDPTPSTDDAAHKIMLNLWPVDNSAAGWAGSFTYPMLPIVGQFKNVSFNAGSDCEFSSVSPPANGQDIQVHSLSMSLNNKSTQANATVHITNNNGEIVEGVTVLGAWSGLVNDGDQEKITDLNGDALFYSRRSRAASGSYQFCITDLLKSGYTWQPDNGETVCSSISIP
ncbi:family 16 glycosylhydrolase [Photobacterium minamisatsumaniensis]|uniref:family 16 glycosylhydrolase n=1 Tax=Photobacterium minamisatsumaniensis TaxID=2910233 RepID=UPI003D1453D8